VTGPEVLDNGVLRAEVLPGVGGTITALCHLASGASVLGSVPWDVTDLPEPSGAAADEGTWLTRFGGGWPLMFPNAGDACTDQGTRHGFHGEASVSPWRVTARGPHDLTLRRRFLSVPVTMTRQIALVADRLEVRETALADSPCAVMWGQHVTFGSDLLAGPVRLSAGAADVRACASFDPPANPLVPGARGDWPSLPGRLGPVDLSRPPEGCAALACLTGFGAAPWVELRRLDGRIAARLEWDADPWPLAWLWIETGGTRDAPWFGRGRLIGVEPCSTWPATGLANARAAGAPLVPLAPGTPVTARISLRAFIPDTPA
jgi:hypothetical protein